VTSDSQPNKFEEVWTTLSAFNAQFGVGQWSVQSISLQLVSSAHNNAIYNDIVPGLFGVSLMQNNSWLEGSGTAGLPATNGITFNSLQSTFINNATDQALGTFSFPGGASGSNSYSLSLSSDLSADLLVGSDVTLRFFAADDHVSYLFNSRNVPPAGQPQLIIAVVPEPGSLALFSAALGLLARTFRGRSNAQRMESRLQPVKRGKTLNRQNIQGHLQPRILAG